MDNLFKKILEIVKQSGEKVKITLPFYMLLGSVFESLSIGLVIPAIIILSKGVSNYTKPIFSFFERVTGCYSYTTFFLISLFTLIIFSFIKTFFITYVNRQQNKFVADLEVSISEKLFKIYLDQPYSVHLQKNSAQLTKNIYFEVKQLCNTIGQALTMLSEILILILIALILFYFQPLATLSAILFLGTIVLLFIRYVRKKLKVWAADRLRSDSERVKVLSNALNNIKDVNLYGRSTKFYDDYKEKSDISAYASMRYTNFLKLPSVWLEFVAVFSLIILVGILTSYGHSMISIIPVLTLFAAALFRTLPSLNRISSAYQAIKFYSPVISSVHAELLANTQSVNTSNHKEKYSPFSDKIVLTDITFNYENALKPTFANLSLTISKANYVGLIGRSGSGKSTLIDIILGLLTPQSGQIKIDGKILNVNNLRYWQDQIGYVSQTINLIDDTIINNVAFGIPPNKIDRRLLNDAIANAQLEEFIVNLPDGWNTLIGEQGIRLSGGQRQRIGIARALYHDPSILVFDEATSSLDVKTEAEIMASIKLLKNKKTILFVTHKNSLLKDCDVIYEMKNGKLLKSL